MRTQNKSAPRFYKHIMWPKTSSGMFYLVLMIALIQPFSSAFSQTPDSETLVTAAVLKDFPPLYSLNEKGEPVGFAIDILKKTSINAGLAVKYLPVENWAMAMQAIRDGKADLIPGIGISPPRSEEFLFTEKIETIPVSCFVRVSNQQIKGIESLTGHRVAVIAQSAAESRLKKIGGMTLVPFPSIDTALFQLLSGDVDAFVFPEPVLKRKLRLMNLNGQHIKVVGKPLMELKRGFMMKKNRHQLAEKYNRAIQSYTLSRQYLADYQKWYGRPEPFWTVELITWSMFAILVLLTFTLSAWRYFSIRTLNQRLQENESLLSTIIHTVPDLVWLKDKEGVYLTCNAKFERFFGHKRSEITGKTDYDFVDRELADFFREKDRESIDCGGPIINEETVIYADDGHTEILETIKTPMHDKRGKLIGVLGIGRDITQRKFHEEKIHTLSTAVEQSPVTVMITDANANIQYVNRAFERISGYRQEEVKGKNPRFLKSGETPKSHYQELWNKITHGDAWQGEFQNRRKNGEIFWESVNIAPVYDDQNQLLHFLAIKEDITLRKQQEEHILHQAHFDSLTNLPNRFLSLDRLSQLLIEANRNHEKVALLFIDLDDFKKINDSMGHETGDKVLIEAANRLSATVRGVDTVGRLGGDEFIVLLGSLTDITDTSSVAESLIERFRTPFNIDERDLILTTSIGIAIYPDDGKTASELLRNADSAMYHSKELGRNTYSFFTENMNQQISRRLHIEEQMHGALERNEFTLHYQPIINLEKNRVTGYEALLRWNNPVLQDISPTEFIPIAEQTGLIIPIGQFVIESALEMLSRKHQNGQDHLISINISPRQFRDPRLVDFIEQAINSSRVSSKFLQLEITEGVLMSGHAYIDKAISRLNKLGVTIAMDDFGTGYSSLSYLRTYPFSTIKIDRSFISDITINKADLELCSAAIAMAHGLGLSVVAEGVETEEQLLLLKSLNCEYVQGYLCGIPTPEQGLQELENSWHC